MRTAVLFVIAQTWGKQPALHSSLRTTCAPIIRTAGRDEPTAARGQPNRSDSFVVNRRKKAQELWDPVHVKFKHRQPQALFPGVSVGGGTPKGGRGGQVWLPPGGETGCLCWWGFRGPY